MMNRRDFLRNGTIVISGLAISNKLTAVPKSLFSKESEKSDFSFEIVTGNPDLAIHHIEQLINDSPLKCGKITLDEFQLSGDHLGDIAFIKNRQLIDFRNSDDQFSRRLAQTCRTLGLPRYVENPSFLRFYPENDSTTPHDVNIIRNNGRIDRLNLSEFSDIHRIEGAEGHLDIAVENHAVRVISTTCKHKTCMKMGSIRHPGQRLLCIPNQIIVSIEGSSLFGVDSITY
jgi:hypothetical protein